MPRKGRLVQPRHIFPWIAAPYIEMLRILWRIERFFFLPIKYLQAWTVSAIFGVLGVLFSVALFIPRLTGTYVEASPAGVRRPAIRWSDMPEIPEEDLALPAGYAPQHLSVEKFKWLRFRENFDQDQIVKTHSQARRPTRSSIAQRDSWTRHLAVREEQDEPRFSSYLRHARVWDNTLLPQLPEYTYDPDVRDIRALTIKNPTLLIEKYVPPVQSPDEPLTYTITVTNNGDEPVESAIVTEDIDISRVIDCEPRAMVSADSKSLIWDLAKLLPHDTHELRVTIQPDKRRSITQETLVSFSSAAVIAETRFREPAREPEPVVPEPVVPEPVKPEALPEPVTRPAVPGQPQLVLEFDPPNSVKVGEELNAYYTITNVGTADATGIRLLVEVPAELRHRYGELVEHKISRLAPNDSRRALFAALAEGSGRLPLHWSLESNELDTQSDAEWLAVLPAPAPTPIESAPVKSSIPQTDPTPLTRETLPTPTENVTDSDQLTPSLPGDVPAASFGTRSLTEPSSIPSWSDPVLGDEAVPAVDSRSTLPIEPQLAPDAEPRFNTEIDTPAEPFNTPLNEPSLPSTVPPSSLPVEGNEGIKAQ